MFQTSSKAGDTVHILLGLSEPSLLAYAINTKIMRESRKLSEGVQPLTTLLLWGTGDPTNTKGGPSSAHQLNAI